MARGVRSENVKSLTNPLNARVARVNVRDDDDVEAYLQLRKLRKPSQQQRRRQSDAPLLAKVDAFERPAESIAGACADFHDDENALIARDEIDLPEPPAEVAHQDSQAPRAQKILGDAFGGAAELG